MAMTGLLILSNPTKIGRILPIIVQHIKKTLYIHLYSNEQNITTESTWPLSSQIIGRIYLQASMHCQHLDVRVLLTSIKYSQLNIQTQRQIDTIFFDKNWEQQEIDFFKSQVKNISTNCRIVNVNTENQEDDDYIDKNENRECKVYENVVLGGTFDRLHEGHKILLNEALLRTTKKLTVGVTDTNMLLSKRLWELIEPCEKRIAIVKDYLQDIDPRVEHDVVAIQDPFGPTKDDPNFQLLIVSSETITGGKKVNELRASKGLRTLDIHAIPLVSNGSMREGEEEKISSSNMRMRSLGSRLKPPKSNNPSLPYIIGLTGGIGSGKSSIGQRLVGLGAALIDCDKLAHELYKPGEPCNKLISETFGPRVVLENGEIDRKSLGAIVFNDKTQLEKLNNLVWPAIGEACQKRIDAFYKAGHKIIVVEAAILLRAGWDKFCDEVWSCIIPADEAICRLQERNKLTEDEARSRLMAQTSNLENVQAANIIFCTLWSTDFTQSQVEKAWKLLQAELKAINKL